MLLNNTLSHISPGQFFPDQLAVYPIRTLKKVNTKKTSLLHFNFKRHISNKEWGLLMYEIAGYLKDKEKGAVYSFFTKNIKEESNEAKWQLCCCGLNKDKKQEPAEVVVFTYDLESLGDIKEKLYSTLENDGFFKDNLENIAMLTKREKEIIGFLSEGMSSKEIADITYISVHTVNTHRHRINKKLDIQNLPDLIKFSHVFDLTCNKINA